ncbi:TonB-dependent receptor [Porphyromonas circumdentaria]|uniref:CarboxypepD_reg-like domain-containing protein n=1 Tax=Porphyromonas circumdentaria TaxID=29524 RepID=A0A1T4LI65_9PORP|nr:TonB-dependent receptor [Porphyromonas circumdentaria]MBB6275245.1 hypothetical protein [Porphyromonas circumdentaria]MDO4722976.1 TonB-dependent receptor [Porphyromonas circumdentaria]SJZ54311.1 CarboxypepD_reg-like domain-containing protein [Porphyromonas circumdentaria]
MNVTRVPHRGFFSRALALLLLLGLSFVELLYAQTSYSLKGKVLDEHTGEALIGANVRLLSASGRQLAGVSTDLTGGFSLYQLPAGNHSLHVSYIGYQVYNLSITLPLQDKEISIRLLEDSKQLSTVVVQSRAADMGMKGDTVVFNANAYRMGSGSSLEDLIKRLPGAQIDESGSIVINGKTIQKIMVDGKEFFSGDTKTATKNLPAEVIEKIEMLDRRSDASRMAGFDDGEEETLLNLSFKPQYKEGFFGNAFGGYGTNRRFEANATLNNFSGANRLTLVAGANNTNNKGISDISNSRGQGGPPRRSAPVGITTSATAAIDIAHTLHKKVEVEGNVRYGYSDKVIEVENAIEYIRSGRANTFASEQSHNRKREHGVGSNLHFAYKPNSLTEILFQPDFLWGKYLEEGREATQTFDSFYKEQTQSDKSYLTMGNNLQTAGVLNISRKLSTEGRVVSLKVSTNYTKDDREGEHATAFLHRLDDTRNESLRLLQKDLTQRISVLTHLSYVEPLGKGFLLQGEVAWRNDRRVGLRDVYTPDVNGNYTFYEERYATSFVNQLSGYNFALNLQRRSDLYDVTLGIGGEPIEMQTSFPFGTMESILKHKFNISPRVTLNLRPNKQTTWRLDYRGDSDMPDVYAMIPVVDPTNPLQITIGNSELAPSFTHRLRSSFRTYNPETRVSINLFTRATYTLNDIAPSVTYDGVSGRQTICYRNVDGNAMWRMFGISSMPLFTPLLTLNAGGRVLFTHQKGFVEERENVANTWVFTPLVQLSYIKGSVYTRFNASLEYRGTTNSLDGLTRCAWRFQTGLEGALDLPIGIKLESDVTFRNRAGYGERYNSTEWIWNAALSYTFWNKQATLRLKSYDLLGSETGISRAATALDLTDSRTNVLGRYVMLHLIYNFGSFSKGASQSDFQSFGRIGGRPSSSVM